VPRKRGDSRLDRLRTLIGRAQARCGARTADLRAAHGWLRTIAHTLAPVPPTSGEAPRTGDLVRRQVEAHLTQLEQAMATGVLATWLHPALTHLVTVVRRLGDGLYHCYDVPDLPRTDNGLEQFYRRVKACERRITGHRRSDQFVLRLGSAAVYAVAASEVGEAVLVRRLAGVAATIWQAERTRLRAHQARQTTMRRFRLHRTAFLADLEARWSALTEAS
jgi:siroheme synthase (precorrin-2 oxidase/ferrochelatase)